MNLKSLKAAALWVWHNEPAVLGGVVTALSATGVITGTEGANLTSAATSIVASAVAIGAAFGVRSQVKPAGK